MKVIKDFDIESLIDLLRTFSYTKEVEGETVTCNVELFTHAQTPIATKFFLQYHGDRVADFVLEQYGEEYITASELSDMIKTVCVQRWKQFYEMWKAEYNPIWNVDGTEKRVIVTEFGKVIEHEKDTTVTDEQKTDGKNNTTHGLVTTITEPTTTGKVAAFDSTNFVDASQTSATQHSNTDSGSTNVAISMGKIEHSAEGTDTDTESGDETVTDTYTRHGNIGVTMSSQLLRDNENFWSQYSFFEHWFDDIAEQISIPMWG